MAAEVLKRDCYIDNIFMGVKSIEEGQKLVKELIDMLATAKLELKQWASNNLQILKDIPKTDLDQNFYIDKDYQVKTLGTFWKAMSDSFVYFVNELSVPKMLTKRIILSKIAKIFDPLGLLGPIILYAKLIMQDIWEVKIGWDEEVPEKIKGVWSEFVNELELLKNVSFSRKVTGFDGKIITLHGFSDACLRGYGACIDIASVDKSGK